MFENPKSKNWDFAPLGKIAPIQYRAIPNSKKIWQLNLDAVQPESGAIIEKHYLSHEELKGSIGGFGADQVLYSKLRPYLNKVVLPDENGVCTTELVPLTPMKNSIDRVYLSSVLRGSDFVSFASQHSKGAKMPRADMKAIKAYQVVLPPLSLQREFADFVSKVNKLGFMAHAVLDTTETAWLNACCKALPNRTRQ